MPRRAISSLYEGLAPPAWSALMAWVGVGAGIMGAAMIAYVAIVAASLIGRARASESPRASKDTGDSPATAWSNHEPGAGAAAGLPARAWTGPLAVFVLIVAMGAFTALAFNALAGLPPVVSGGGGH